MKRVVVQVLKLALSLCKKNTPNLPKELYHKELPLRGNAQSLLLQIPYAVLSVHPPANPVQGLP